MINQTDECLRRAYAACERGMYDLAIDHLEDAASFAWMDGNIDQHAAAVRARVSVMRVVNRRHMQVLR
jgi:hypothetical protein